MYVKETTKLVHLRTDGTKDEDQTIDTTANHPFYVEGRGWVAAEDIEAGDRLHTEDGSVVVVTDNETEKLRKPIKVYNLEVEDYHTYYVTRDEVLVHNMYKKGSNSGSSNWVRMTSKESRIAAKKLGYDRTNFTAKNKEPIYYNSDDKTYISQDIGSGDGSGPHNGGVWKMAKDPKKINIKSQRMGTYDENLNRI